MLLTGSGSGSRPPRRKASTHNPQAPIRPKKAKGDKGPITINANHYDEEADVYVQDSVVRQNKKDAAWREQHAIHDEELEEERLLAYDTLRSVKDMTKAEFRIIRLNIS